MEKAITRASARAANQIQRPHPEPKRTRSSNTWLAGRGRRSPTARTPPARQNRETCRGPTSRHHDAEDCQRDHLEHPVEHDHQGLERHARQLVDVADRLAFQPPQRHAKSQARKNHRQHAAIVAQGAEQAFGNVVQKLRQGIRRLLAGPASSPAVRPARSNCRASRRWPRSARSRIATTVLSSSSLTSRRPPRPPVRHASCPHHRHQHQGRGQRPQHPQHQFARQFDRRDQAGQHREFQGLAGCRVAARARSGVQFRRPRTATRSRQHAETVPIMIRRYSGTLCRNANARCTEAGRRSVGMGVVSVNAWFSADGGWLGRFRGMNRFGGAGVRRWCGRLCGCVPGAGVSCGRGRQGVSE